MMTQHFFGVTHWLRWSSRSCWLIWSHEQSLHLSRPEGWSAAPGTHQEKEKSQGPADAFTSHETSCWHLIKGDICQGSARFRSSDPQFMNIWDMLGILLPPVGEGICLGRKTLQLSSCRSRASEWHKPWSLVKYWWLLWCGGRGGRLCSSQRCGQ